jgi:single-stranded DNA-binding protein
MENILSNNEVLLEGRVSQKTSFSHEIYGESFYKFMIKIPRLSDTSDEITVTVSERLLDDVSLDENSFVRITGQFRSYNNYTESGNKLVLTVFARTIENCEESSDSPNQIYLNGYLCKMPVYRTTPFGREIADILLAVNRQYGKSDYIPCITWGRNSKFANNLEVGTNLKIWGRIQSRVYKKKIDEDNYIEKTAYEVSVSKMEVVG